jgi:hypothetical protein
VKRWKGLSLQSSQKKHFHNKGHTNKAYFCTLLLASFIGTYLDLWMVGKGFYSFPARPFPTIFSINILFTLCILPIFSFFIVYLFKRINGALQLLVTILVSIIISIFEHYFEQLGLFVHSNEWNHWYSTLGYFIFILLIWKFYKWLSKY